MANKGPVFFCACGTSGRTGPGGGSIKRSSPATCPPEVGCNRASWSGDGRHPETNCRTVEPGPERGSAPAAPPRGNRLRSTRPFDRTGAASRDQQVDNTSGSTSFTSPTSFIIAKDRTPFKFARTFADGGQPGGSFLYSAGRSYGTSLRFGKIKKQGVFTLFL